MPYLSFSLCSCATWSVVFSQLSISVFQGFCFCYLRLQIRNPILDWEMRSLMILRSPLCWLQFYCQVEESMSIYVASRRLSGGTTVTALRYATSLRSYSTSFREERDTFGPIQVPSDKFGIWSLRNVEFSLILEGNVSQCFICCVSQIVGSPDAEIAAELRNRWWARANAWTNCPRFWRLEEMRCQGNILAPGFGVNLHLNSHLLSRIWFCDELS